MNNGGIINTPSRNGGRVKATMKDVSEAAGVSVSTVSHVLNGTRFVSAEAIAKVEDAVGRLNFKVNPNARNLRKGKSFLIGFVVSNLQSYFYVNIAKGIEKIINAQGYQLTLINSAECKNTEIQNIESLCLRGVDGIIMVPATNDCAYLRDILPPDFPIVFIDRQPLHYKADSVLLNNVEASYNAAQYFIGKGFTKIGFTAFHFGEKTIDSTIMERIEGYKKAHREAGLPVNPDYIKTIAGASVPPNELRMAEPYNIMKNFHNLGVQAVLCGNSLSAIGVFNYLKDAGLRIPYETALITFDDELWLSMTTPRISAVAQPSQEIGAAAAKCLLKRIKSQTEQSFVTLRLDAKIIFRESS